MELFNIIRLGIIMVVGGMGICGDGDDFFVNIL